jgi:hypothetical protein
MIFCEKTAQMGVDCGLEHQTAQSANTPSFTPPEGRLGVSTNFAQKAILPVISCPKVSIGDDAIQAAQSAFL